MPFRDAKFKNARPTAKPRKLADEKGLYLLIQPGGSKLWRLKYRFAGKEKLLSIGAYPDVSLAKARDERDAARRLLADDTDPGEQRRQAKVAQRVASANSFEAVAQEWLDKQTLAPATRAKNDWLLRVLLLPWLRARPVADINAQDLLRVLRHTESRNKLESAQRALQLAGRIFRYAVATGRSERDPAADLRGALATPKTKHRASITDPKEIGPLLRALHGYSGTFSVACALKLAPLLIVRPGELRHAEWSEINLEAGDWRIPDTKSWGEGKIKTGGVHIVPLCEQARTILRELQPLTGAGRYLFPSVRAGGRPMSENTVNAALRRLGYTSEQMCGHGFRSMASTRLHEMGWPHPAIELQLAHAVGNQVSRAYNYAEHLPERRKMMQAWADYLDALRDKRKIVAGNFGKAA